MLFVLYVNSLPDVVRSSQIAAFADDTKVFKEITTTSDAEQLQEDLSDLVTCKAASLGNLNPSSLSIIWPALNLKLSLPEKDLGVYITDNLMWHKQVNVQCAKASRLLGHVRRNTRLVKTITGRRPACLTLVRSLLAM